MATIGSIGTGNTGQLIIDDDGTYVRLYIVNGSSQTFANGKAWSVTFSGIGSDSGSFNMATGPRTIQVGGNYVPGYSQTVTFTMGATGTTGLGGPTSISASIFRPTIPATPNTPTVTEIMPTSMKLNWSIPSDGGAAIDQVLLRRSQTADFASYVDYTWGGATQTSYTVTGLTPGVKYFWRVYVHNGVGYSNNSGTASATTLSGFKVWNGTQWKPTVLRVWDGTSWKVCQLKAWDGTTWKVCG